MWPKEYQPYKSIQKKKSTNSSSDNLKRKQLHETLVVVVVRVVVGVCFFNFFFQMLSTLECLSNAHTQSVASQFHCTAKLSSFFFVFSLSYLNWFLVSQALLRTNVWHTRTIACLDVMWHSVLDGGHTRWKCQIFFGFFFFFFFII